MSNVFIARWSSKSEKCTHQAPLGEAAFIAVADNLESKMHLPIGQWTAWRCWK